MCGVAAGQLPPLSHGSLYAVEIRCGGATQRGCWHLVLIPPPYGHGCRWQRRQRQLGRHGELQLHGRNGGRSAHSRRGRWCGGGGGRGGRWGRVGAVPRCARWGSHHRWRPHHCSGRGGGHRLRQRDHRLKGLHLLELPTHHTADEGSGAGRIVEPHLAPSTQREKGWGGSGPKEAPKGEGGRMEHEQEGTAIKPTDTKGTETSTMSVWLPHLPCESVHRLVPSRRMHSLASNSAPMHLEARHKEMALPSLQRPEGPFAYRH